MMKVRLDPQDEARLDKLIALGTIIVSKLTAIDASTSAAAAQGVVVENALAALAADVHAIREAVVEPPVVGIEITPGPPTTRTTEQETKAMATDPTLKSKMTVKVVKKDSGGSRVPKKTALGADAVALTSFQLQDNNDDTYTVQGVDGAGFPVDISTVATLTPAPTSANPAALTVDAPTGMTFAVHGVAPGESDVTATATWNDGSLGPFTFTLPTTVTAGPAGGIVITPGTPTVR